MYLPMALLGSGSRTQASALASRSVSPRWTSKRAGPIGPALRGRYASVRGTQFPTCLTTVWARPRLLPTITCTTASRRAPVSSSAPTVLLTCLAKTAGNSTMGSMTRSLGAGSNRSGTTPPVGQVAALDGRGEERVVGTHVPGAELLELAGDAPGALRAPRLVARQLEVQVDEHAVGVIDEHVEQGRRDRGAVRADGLGDEVDQPPLDARHPAAGLLTKPQHLGVVERPLVLVEPFAQGLDPASRRLPRSPAHDHLALHLGAYGVEPRLTIRGTERVEDLVVVL